MSITITNETSEVFHQPALRLHLDHAPMHADGERPDSHSAFWDSSFEQLYFDGIHAGFCQAQVHHTVCISSGDTMPVPGLVFMQRGDITAVARAGDRPHRFASGEHNFVFDPYATAGTMIPKQSQLEVFVLSFMPERFLQLVANTGPVMDRIANAIAAERHFTFHQRQNMPITPRMQALIMEIRQCRYQSGLQKLFLQSRAIELLALQCEQLETAYGNSPRASRMTPADIKRIHHVREILLNDIQHPPTLTELSRQSGLNEFKLKTGFKEVFHHTVFGYLKAYRLERARTLLKEKELSVTQIAYETGYTSLHHFSNEFKKHFGVSPAGMR